MKRLILILAVLLAFAFEANAQQRITITGEVTNSENGESLPGVTILLKGSTIGTTTNADGEYSINIPNREGTLVFSFVGFESQEVKIEGRRTINIELKPDLAKLDDVVVVGYGSKSRRKVTSSISTVNEEQIQTANLRTIENALQGAAAGVQVTNIGGLIGSPVNVRVRGTGSITGDSQPLYVVDGIPITVGDGDVGLGIGGSGTNPLKNINPQDIESIEVLKDASASAIYGSRGANGVVLISTKSGKAGQTEVNFSYSAGFTDDTETFDMMNGQQFGQIWNDAAANLFGLPLDTEFGNLGGFGIPEGDDVPTTDWQDVVTRTGFVQQASFSVSGGDQKTQFRVSGSVDDQNGFVTREKQQRFSLRAKVDHNVSDKLRVGLNIAPTLSLSQRVGERNAVAAPLTFGALYFPNVEARNEDGSPNLDIGANPFGQFNGTPLSNQIGNDSDERFNQIVTSANLTYNITPTLTATSDFSVEFFDFTGEQKNSSITTDGFGIGQGFGFHNKFINYNFNGLLNYANTFDKHEVDVTVGGNTQRSFNTSLNVSGNNFATDQLQTLNTAGNITGGGQQISNFAFIGLVSRMSYTYNNKYIATFNARYDGSSRFDENQFGFFPAGSVGWIMSDEDFLQDSDIVDFLKLRVSFGLTGNADGIGNFPALGLFNVTDFNQQSGTTPVQVANPGLEWEKATQLDVSVDYGFVNSRIRGSITYYNETTDDLLLNVPVSPTNGFVSFNDNRGEVENKGIEFDIEGDIFAGNNFSWTSSFNVAWNKNEVEELVSPITGGVQTTREGDEIGTFFLREFAGADNRNGDAVWFWNGDPNSQEAEALAAAGTIFKTDEFGDRYITNNFNTANRIDAGDPFPEVFGGFTNTFQYKNLTARVFLQYQIGNQIYRADGTFTDTNLSSVFNQSTRQLNYWTPENTDTDIPRPILFGSNGNQTSTRFLEDGSYLRLKSLNVSYTLPRSLTNNLEVRVFSEATNLATITDFKGLDPEATAPPGNNLNQGNVFFAPPQARTIRFGVDLNF